MLRPHITIITFTLNLYLHRVWHSATTIFFVITTALRFNFNRVTIPTTSTAYNSTLQKCGVLWFIDVLFFAHNIVVKLNIYSP